MRTIVSNLMAFAILYSPVFRPMTIWLPGWSLSVQDLLLDFFYPSGLLRKMGLMVLVKIPQLLPQHQENTDKPYSIHMVKQEEKKPMLLECCTTHCEILFSRREKDWTEVAIKRKTINLFSSTNIDDSFERNAEMLFREGRIELIFNPLLESRA